MGRKALPEEIRKGSQITVRIQSHIYDELKEVCYQRRTAVATVLTEMIEKYLAKARKKQV